jgi:signal transduction histidine kinase
MLNILVVDDDEGDRKQIKRVLKHAGMFCSYTEAVSVKDALKACDKCDFDCAIIDYRMPGEDGLAGIAALHERLPYMAVIMATGQGDEMVATEAMKRGALDYFPKSSIDAQFIRRITEGAIEKASLLRRIAEQREELETFACMLVHDLTTPIRSVALLTDLMERRIQKGHPEELVELCSTVKKSAQRMGELIDTLRQYTQAEQKVVFEPVAMEEVVRDSLINLEHMIQKRGARVTLGELPTVSGNPPQLIQLVQNLIGNGIKYCEEKIPAIHVIAKTHEGGVWLFSVKDNGIGIPDEYHRRIFEPFKRVCDESKYDGTGLGLATCRKIVERHHGGIWCESREGEGTNIFFTLREAHNKVFPALSGRAHVDLELDNRQCALKEGGFV